MIREEDRGPLYRKGRELMGALRVLGLNDAADTVGELCEVVIDDGGYIAFGRSKELRAEYERATAERGVLFPDTGGELSGR